jgi:hypothetical protein
MAEERAPDAFLRKKSGENGETPETPHPENLDLEPLENQQIDEAEADLASLVGNSRLKKSTR